MFAEQYVAAPPGFSADQAASFTFGLKSSPEPGHRDHRKLETDGSSKKVNNESFTTTQYTVHLSKKCTKTVGENQTSNGFILPNHIRVSSMCAEIVFVILSFLQNLLLR